MRECGRILGKTTTNQKSAQEYKYKYIYKHINIYPNTKSGIFSFII
jgi:hypothetical protein